MSVQTHSSVFTYIYMFILTAILSTKSSCKTPFHGGVLSKPDNDESAARRKFGVVCLDNPTSRGAFVFVNELCLWLAAERTKQTTNKALKRAENLHRISHFSYALGALSS